MKKTMKSILALAVCAVAMGFASCSDDDDVNSADGNKEYLFAAGCRVSTVDGDETGEIRNQQQEYVNAALAKVGFTGESDYPLSILGKDSAAVSKVLLEKMAQVEKAISDAPFEINARLSVKGAEKSIVASDDKGVRIITTWYKKTFGSPVNGVSFETIFSYSLIRQFVHELKTRSGTSYSDDYVSMGCDLNDGAGGDFIYLRMHCGQYVAHSSSGFKWHSGENYYITDVIAVNGGWSSWKPDKLYIRDKGRYYYLETGVGDLNAGCGEKTDYIWIYTTHEKFQESDGKYYYLNTGDYIQAYTGFLGLFKERVHKGSCTVSDGDNFNAFSYAQTTPFVDEGHKFIERVVPMYNTSGILISDQADFNQGAGGDFIRMILSYATQEGGY